MLDFSFGELVMIGAVALVVLGPERLPRVARAFGEFLGKAQRYVSQVRADIQREVELADLKRLQEEARQAAQSIDSSVRDVAASVEEASRIAPAEASAATAASERGAPAWEGGGWGSHRFRTRPRPSPSVRELADQGGLLRSQLALPGRGRRAGHRYAPR